MYKIVSKNFDIGCIYVGSTINFNKRRKAYRNAQKTLWEESGTMIPYHVSKLVVTNSRVKNLDEVEVFSVQWHKVKVD